MVTENVVLHEKGIHRDVVLGFSGSLSFYYIKILSHIIHCQCTIELTDVSFTADYNLAIDLEIIFYKFILFYYVK